MTARLWPGERPPTFSLCPIPDAELRLAESNGQGEGGESCGCPSAFPSPAPTLCSPPPTAPATIGGAQGGAGRSVRGARMAHQQFSVPKNNRVKGNTRACRGCAPHTWWGEGKAGKSAQKRMFEAVVEPGLGCGEYLGHQGASGPDHREPCVLSVPLPPAGSDSPGDPNTPGGSLPAHHQPLPGALPDGPCVRKA